MDRETRRIVESYRRDEAGPLENQVIDELLGGEVDRQEFLQRATMYGLGAGTIGALLRFVGEADLAYGASLDAVQGRRHDPPRHPGIRERRSSRTCSTTAARSRSPASPASTSRSRTRQARSAPWLGDELEDERRRNGLDVPAPQGRAVPQRQGDDVGRRRREHEAVRRQGLERRPRPLLRRRRESRRVGRYTGRLPAEVADRRLPVPPQSDDVPGDHPAGVDRGQAGHAGLRAA